MTRRTFTLLSDPILKDAYDAAIDSITSWMPKSSDDLRSRIDGVPFVTRSELPSCIALGANFDGHYHISWNQLRPTGHELDTAHRILEEVAAQSARTVVFLSASVPLRPDQPGLLRLRQRLAYGKLNYDSKSLTPFRSVQVRAVRWDQSSEKDEESEVLTYILQQIGLADVFGVEGRVVKPRDPLATEFHQRPVPAVW